MLNREPTVGEIAESLSVTPESVTEALCAAQPTMSLTLDNDEGTSEFDIAVEGENEKLLEHISLKEVLSALPDMDRKLIILRYYKSKTQTETAVLLGMTQVQVSRKERAILLKMRQMLA